MSDSCFVCTTPYQIIAASTIAIEEGKSSDLLIVPQFDKAVEYAERIRHLNIYEEVLLVNTKKIEAYKKRKNRLLYGLGIIANYLRLDEIVHEIIGNKDYKTIFISSQANIGRLMCLYFLQKGKEIIYFDDGEGSYDDYKIYEAQGIDRTIRKLFFGKKSIRLSDRRLLYCPKIYEMTFGKSDHVSAIPNWSRDVNLTNVINSICGYSEAAAINHKYVLLDTIPSENFEKSGQDKYEKLVDICVDVIGKELLIKKHPRDNRQYKKKCAIYQYPAIPFEVLCANSDVGNKVLICSGSSAVLTPKLLFDAEPVVILLHHIVGSRLGDIEKRETLISCTKNLYQDKSKFIVPETIEEFKASIETLKSREDV